MIGGTGIAPTRKYLFALGVAAAPAIFTGLAADARADLYSFSQDGRVTSRTVPYLDHTGTAQTALDFGYKGPRVTVQANTTNKDTYSCPIAKNYAETFSSWVAVADDLSTFDLVSFSSTSDIYFRADQSYIGISTTNVSWSGAYIRVVASCTPDPSVIPYTPAAGDYLDAWHHSLNPGVYPRPALDWAGLIRNAFSWGKASARASSATAVRSARKHRQTFALRNGANTLSVRFSHPRTTQRPPAFYLSTQPANAACRTTGLHSAVIDGVGSAHVRLRCRGLARGATAQVKVRQAVRRTFRLRKGKGSVQVRLRKPPGSVKPLVHLSTRPANTPCKVLRRGLRLERTTFDVRMDGHCGRVARGAVGEIAIGGLLAGPSR
jgi:hypothetical protein